MKQILFFDTETTGIWIKNGYMEEQPHIVQLWAIFWKYDDSGSLISTEIQMNKTFNPWIPIPKQSSDIHWITDEMVKNEPELIQTARDFVTMIYEADIIVGHNVDFDFIIISNELRRIAEKTDWHEVDKFNEMFKSKLLCTMQSSIDFCKIPWKYGNYKWPKLSELHIKLFWKDFDGAHDAFADIVATKDCYFELRKKKLL